MADPMDRLLRGHRDRIEERFQNVLLRLVHAAVDGPGRLTVYCIPDDDNLPVCAIQGGPRVLLPHHPIVRSMQGLQVGGDGFGLLVLARDCRLETALLDLLD